MRVSCHSCSLVFLAMQISSNFYLTPHVLLIMSRPGLWMKWALLGEVSLLEFFLLVYIFVPPHAFNAFFLLLSLLCAFVFCALVFFSATQLMFSVCGFWLFCLCFSPFHFSLFYLLLFVRLLSNDQQVKHQLSMIVQHTIFSSSGEILRPPPTPLNIKSSIVAAHLRPESQ